MDSIEFDDHKIESTLDEDENSPLKKEFVGFNVKVESDDFYEDLNTADCKGQILINNKIEKELEEGKDKSDNKFDVKVEAISDIEYEDEVSNVFVKPEELIIKDEGSDNLSRSQRDDTDCSIIVIIDNPVPMGAPDRATQTIPKRILTLKSSPEHSFGIYTLRYLKKGVQLGPYEGRFTKVESPEGYSWKLDKGRVEDESYETNSNYLRYINCARDETERNLEAFQYKGELYYRTCRGINTGEELLIYFDKDKSADCYYKPQEENLGEFHTCQFCDIKFKFKEHWDKHQKFCKFRTGKPKIFDGPAFQCKHCLCFLRSLELLTSHEGDCERRRRKRKLPRKISKPEEIEKTYACDHCSYTTTRVNYLYRHKRHQHNKTNIFKCSECDYETYIKINFNAHRAKHERKSMFKCTNCDYVTHFKHHLNQHARKHNRKNFFKCPDCDYETCYRFNLGKHRLKHEKSIRFKCTDCDFETHSEYFMTKHRLKHEIVHEEKDLFKCTDCEYQSYSKSNYNQHRRKHEWKNVYRCTECDYETFSKFYLNLHKKRHAKITSFTCEKCEKGFFRKYELDRHILVRHPDMSHVISSKLHTCTTCGYSTVQKSSFDKHILLHSETTVKDIKCEQCNYETNYKPHLQKHMLIHKTQRLICTACQKSFKQKRCLDSHILKTHYNDEELVNSITHKIFSCDSCDFRCIKIPIFKRHVQTHVKS